LYFCDVTEIFHQQTLRNFTLHSTMTLGTKKNGGTTLLLIDVQKDFHPGGSLAIPTAGEDAERIANAIRTNGGSIDRIIATMDSHHKLHIAHPSFWVSGDDEKRHPSPFTIISTDEIALGKWVPRSDLKLPVTDPLLDPSVFVGMERAVDSDNNFNLTNYCIEYCRQLDIRGRNKLCIWPEHCLIGTNGHGVVDNVQAAMEQWSETTGGSIEWVLKGQNLLTEMYSALASDVPVCSSTSFNYKLQKSLRSSDRLIVCGQAMSHCVNYTLRDIVDHWPQEDRAKIILATDCCSAVPGFEDAAKTFQEDMKEAGITLSTVDRAFGSS
jgi:nicotinamidase-related amidase